MLILVFCVWQLSFIFLSIKQKLIVAMIKLKQNIEFLNLKGGPVPANIGDAEFTSRYARPAPSPSVLKQRANKRD